MTGFLYAVYRILTWLFLPFLLLFALGHWLVNPALRLYYLQRFGLSLPPHSPARPVWVHAVSMGEILSCVPLISRLRQEGFLVCLSTGTRTGYTTAARHLPGIAVFYLPLDYTWCIRRILRHVSPVMVLISEIEIWPAFVRGIKSINIPLFLISGRMPERDFRNFQRFRFCYNRVLSCYDGLFMQSDNDTERMRQLCNHNHLRTLGNLKFDVSPGELSPGLSALLPPGKITICGASTHPGDEKLILEAFHHLYERNRGLRLILAPISQARVQEIARLASSHGLNTDMRSANRISENPVFILDSVGELACFFSRCDLVIMGGTFSRQTGGHNIIEPALHGNCILCGPHMENFQGVYDIFSGAEALIPTSKEGLASDLAALVANEPRARSVGQRAKAILARQQGSTERVYQAISGFLPNRSTA
jgi:3-deoxy-D-manno-octulosonic-acid transferase